MKTDKKIFGLLLLMILTYSIQAQSYKVNEIMTVIDGEYTKAMMINLPSEADEMEEEWGDYLEDNYELELDKVKRKRDTTIYISEKVINDNLNGISYDIYTKVVDRTDGSTNLYTKWAFNEDILIESEDNPKKAADAKYMMEDFAQKTYISYYTKQLNDLADERVDIVKSYGKLGNRNEHLEKRNQKLEKKINSYKGEIDLNKTQKEANQTEMEKLEKISNSLEKQIDVIQFELEKVKM